MKQTVYPPAFEKNYQTHLKRPVLNGMQPKTIEAYAHGVRRAGAYFDYQIDALNDAQLTEYFGRSGDQGQSLPFVR